MLEPGVGGSRNKEACKKRKSPRKTDRVGKGKENAEQKKRVVEGVEREGKPTRVFL